MQSVASRDALLSRRGRAACPVCGLPVEMARMRAHLREAHQVPSSNLETTLLTARRQARRSSRGTRR